MGARSDHKSPRIAPVLQPGQDVPCTGRESPVATRDALDARELDDLEGLIGALSRTQMPRLDAMDGFEPRL